jgi:hypothetical protein
MSQMNHSHGFNEGSKSSPFIVGNRYQSVQVKMTLMGLKAPS